MVYYLKYTKQQDLSLINGFLIHCDIGNSDGDILDFFIEIERTKNFYNATILDKNYQSIHLSPSQKDIVKNFLETFCSVEFFRLHLLDSRVLYDDQTSLEIIYNLISDTNTKCQSKN